MARVPAFQAGYAGSIPVTRSISTQLFALPKERMLPTSSELQQDAVAEVVEGHFVDVFGTVFFINLLTHVGEAQSPH
jgi:hypothetical protein